MRVYNFHKHFNVGLKSIRKGDFNFTGNSDLILLAGCPRKLNQMW